MGILLEPGSVIDGKYRVVRRIGEGGMGTVYEGENIRIERRVAIKVLHEHVASSPEFAQRFEREARASARIGSPHVCDVLDLGDHADGKFIVMEYLDGESLEDRLLKKKLTAAELAPIAFEILEGLGTMHQAGVIHRDLKPANVFLARGPSRRAEVVKILDFGVAKITPKAEEPSDMTSTGMMMGTPLYMSPEQARGARDVDGRTDLYAASVIFYRALTGELPHTGINLHELLFKIVLEDPKSIIELTPDVDDVFASIVMKGLARDADQRYPSARAYQEEIAAWGQQQGRSSLQFAVTLSSDPPPLRISGGFPVSAIAQSRAPNTGPQPRSGEHIGPPTPAMARTQTATPSANANAAAGMSASASDASEHAKRKSGGTPIAWSEDAPDIVKRAHAELEARNAANVSANANANKATKPSPGAEVLEAARVAEAMIAAQSTPAMPAAMPSNGSTGPIGPNGTSPLARPITAPVAIPTHVAGVVNPAHTPQTFAAPPPPKTSPILIRALIGVGAVVIIVAAIVGGKMARSASLASSADGGSGPTTAGSGEPPSTSATSDPTGVPTQITATTTAVAEPETSAAPTTKILPLPSASTTTTTTTTTTVATAARPTATTASSTKAAPSASASAAAAPTTAPTTTASGHRKFRTNLE